MGEFNVKQFLPRSLYGRSLMILIAPILIIQAFTAFMFLDRHWDTMTQRLAGALAGEIAIIADRYEKSPYSDNAQMVADYAAEYLDITVQYSEGGVLSDHFDHARFYTGWAYTVKDSLAAALDEKVRRPYHIDLSIKEKWVQIFIQLDNGVLTVNAPIRRLFSSSGYIFLLWMVGTTIIMMVIAILFMRNQVRPIRRLAIAAERYGKGIDVPYLKPSGAREVRAAIASFGKMKERLDRQIQQRTSMLAGVSHDLRTPLTRMKIQLSMDEGNEALQELKKDVQDMERMIDSYLEFVRGDGDEIPERLSLSDFVERVVENVKRGGASITVERHEDAMVMLRPLAFERCLLNILNNAEKHAQTIWVRIAVRDDLAEIIVDDDGPGVSEDLYDDVFKPFFRAEESRNQKTGGVGLGLSIAKDIAQSHGGDITLSRSDRGGLRVTISLPL